ncbi:hypothetical protein RB213_012795 [Colletotrichum asianum]|uniref:Uncharacterized protein n=1 Tax=Colletotrichum asianum TaxID=702518 RepID=A0A8H3ZL30_9PEZI|nr:hypothetical protein GQ607_017109 [Colletotrichum asianum]
MGCPDFIGDPHNPKPAPLDPSTECPVCAIKARMANPDRNPTWGHRDYPADRLIDLIIKYTPIGPNPMNKAEEIAICGVVSTWCGRSEKRRFKSLRLCDECYGKHVGVPFRAESDWLLNSAAGPNDVDL